MTTQTYQEASLHLLAQAETELAEGDIRQASEKGWGSAALAVKAVCEQRGWRHASHALLHQAVSQLVKESGEEDIERLFSVAARLHINFYENWLDAETVDRGLDDVRNFVGKLDALP